MIRAVFDTNLLVSAFLTRDNPGGVTAELLRFVIEGAIDLYLSVEIADEVVKTLSEGDRLQKRYVFSQEQVGQYRADLLTLATVVDDPPPTQGAVPRDPDDDKIVACAVAADLQDAIRRYIREHNRSSKPFLWTKPAHTILAKLSRLPVPSE